jgi:hypothetical protein
MPGTLTAGQLSYLASELDQYAKVIESYRESFGPVGDGTLDPAVNTKLDDAETKILDASENLATTAAAMMFDEPTNAYQTLHDVTADANAKAHELGREVATYTKLANLTASVVTFALSFAQGPGAVLNAGGTLAGTISGL